MTILLDKDSLYNTFGVKSFDSLETNINNMAPSLVEYYLSDLSQYCEDSYLNKTQIENSIYIGDYNIYKDYNENVYLEFTEEYSNDSETASFW